VISQRNYLAISEDASKGAIMTGALRRVVTVGGQSVDIFGLKTKKIASKDELDTGRGELLRLTQIEERERVKYMKNVANIFSKDN
jgi:hypothetical protein